MKILIIMDGFIPGKKYGGPPISVNNFCSLMYDNDCYIVTHNHDKDESTCFEEVETGKWVKRENCSVLYLPDIEYVRSKFEMVISDISPDILYLQGLFQSCIVPCLQIAKKYGIKVLLAPRGELCSGAFKKKYKKIPYIYMLKTMGLLQDIFFQSTSEEESQAIERYLGISNSRIFFLTNIPSIPKKKYIRDKKKVGVGRFVFLSRIHPKKNLISAIRYFERVKGTVTFDIYGPLEDEKYWEECKEVIRRLPSNITVNYCGVISHDEVHEVFSNYDAFIFPTFSENFGHVIAEALIVGTIVIISDQTPWNDVNNNQVGYALPLNNEEKFVYAIQSIIEMDDDAIKNIRKKTVQYAKEKIKIKKLRLEYLNCIHTIIGE